MALKTDYKDDVLSGERKYVIVENGDGTVSLRDVTQYTQVGDSFGALDINNTNEAVNSIQDDIGFTGTGAEIEQAMEDELVHEGEKYYETDDYDDIPWNANQVEYDHTASGLSATSVQGAIDELALGSTSDVVMGGNSKTMQQVLNELYAKIDHSKIKPTSSLVEVYYENGAVKQYRLFTCDYFDMKNHSYSFVHTESKSSEVMSTRFHVSTSSFAWESHAGSTFSNTVRTNTNSYNGYGYFILY